MKPSFARLKYEVENPVGMRVYAYRNLHKDCFSLMDTRGRVIKHVDGVLLKDVEFRVRKRGQERVRRTGQRHVHAFAIGEVVAINDEFEVDYGVRVIYNPFSGMSNFVTEIVPQSIYEAKSASLTMEGGHGILRVNPKLV